MKIRTGQDRLLIWHGITHIKVGINQSKSVGDIRRGSKHVKQRFKGLCVLLRYAKNKN